jgi:hypothetical protein
LGFFSFSPNFGPGFHGPGHSPTYRCYSNQKRSRQAQSGAACIPAFFLTVSGSIFAEAIFGFGPTTTAFSWVFSLLIFANFFFANIIVAFF